MREGKEGREEIGNPRKMTNEFSRGGRSGKISRLDDDTFRRGHSSNFMVKRELLKASIPMRCVHNSSKLRYRQPC